MTKTFSDTIKLMPEGALYWYGNECESVTGGWNKDYIYDNEAAKGIGIRNKNTNCLNGVSSTNRETALFVTDNDIQTSNCTAVNISVAMQTTYYLAICFDFYIKSTNIATFDNDVDVKNEGSYDTQTNLNYPLKYKNNKKCGICGLGCDYNLYAMWLS